MQAPYRIKVCGLTQKEDVLAAVEAGADAVGFVLAGGPRKLNAHEAGIIALFVPPDAGVKRVALISEPGQLPPREAKWFDLIQVHGEQDAASLAALHDRYGLPLVRAVSARPGWKEEAAGVLSVQGVAAVLVDAHVPGMLGGTGKTVDWEEVGAREAGLNPLVLAGGLNPENVAEAVRLARPVAVDASSGLEVEGRPGLKDHGKLRAYVRAAQTALSAL